MLHDSTIPLDVDTFQCKKILKIRNLFKGYTYAYTFDCYTYANAFDFSYVFEVQFCFCRSLYVT